MEQKFQIVLSFHLLNNFGSVAKNLAPLQNHKKPSQFGKLIIFIRKKMTYKGENYSVKMQKYYFCNGTTSIVDVFLCVFKFASVGCEKNSKRKLT